MFYLLEEDCRRFRVWPLANLLLEADAVQAPMPVPAQRVPVMMQAEADLD